MSFSVLVTDSRFTDYSIEREVIEKAGGRLIIKDEKPIEEAAISMEALLVNLAPVTEETLSKLKKLRVVSRYGVGYDNVDVKACKKFGIALTNVPDYCRDEAAEHALALTLASLRKIAIHDRHIRQGEWNITAGNPVYNIKSLSLGILGYGKIGKRFHELISGFGFKNIFICSPSSDEEEIASNGGVKVDFERMLRESDIITIHVPLNESSASLFNEEAFSLMKEGSLLVNTSRGKVVCQTSLCDALKKGKIAAAALDVFEEEPIPKNNPLLSFENVILTDHQAWYSEQSIAKLKYLAAKNVVSVLTGESSASRVV